MTVATRFGINFDMSGAVRKLDVLQKDVEEAIRPAAQAGANVIYDDVMKNVGQMTDAYTGSLEKSIYQVWSRKRSSKRKHVYEISYNKVKAPHGHLIEFGYTRRYQVRQSKSGKWYTVVRPEKLAEYRAWKRANPGKDIGKGKSAEYFMPRKGGPYQVLAKPFLRRAIDKFPAAHYAMRDEFIARVVKHESRI